MFFNRKDKRHAAELILAEVAEEQDYYRRTQPRIVSMPREKHLAVSVPEAACLKRALITYMDTLSSSTDNRFSREFALNLLRRL